jgi:hypothetical protein
MGGDLAPCCAQHAHNVITSATQERHNTRGKKCKNCNDDTLMVCTSIVEPVQLGMFREKMPTFDRGNFESGDMVESGRPNTGMDEAAIYG